MNRHDSSSGVAEASSTKTRMVLIAAAVAILLMLGIYFWGNVQTRNQLAAQGADHQQSVAAVQQQLKTVQGELATARNRNHLLIARTDLYRAAADLDQRNFGIANTRLQDAAAALGRIDASAGALDAAKLDALRSSIQAMNITVATDLQQQRNQVLAVAAQMDALAVDAQPQP